MVQSEYTEYTNVPFILKLNPFIWKGSCLNLLWGLGFIYHIDIILKLHYINLNITNFTGKATCKTIYWFDKVPEMVNCEIHFRLSLDGLSNRRLQILSCSIVHQLISPVSISLYLGMLIYQNHRLSRIVLIPQTMVHSHTRYNNMLFLEHPYLYHKDFI